ncbi:MAG: alkaline phosphatase family protein [Actinomycetota bacterium]
MVTKRGSDVPNQSRREFLAALGIGAVALGAGGAVLARRLAQPTDAEIVEEMARDLGAEYTELVRRGFYAGRSGELQLLVAPFSTSNYSQESRSLVPSDPRTSHSQVWKYLERVPITVYAPGLVKPGTFDDSATLADVAPTASTLIKHDFETPDGAALPGVTRPKRAPKVVVVFVIDGGGWNVLNQWPDAWPQLKALMRKSAVYRNVLMGSFPAVTASAHATIGTGAFPREHGISGHFLRKPDGIRKAYGEPGEADPFVLRSPTLADSWAEATGNKAWIGEIGYQVWHVGMIGRASSVPNRKPVAVYFDEESTTEWQPQNPEYYRLPRVVPSRALLDRYSQVYQRPTEFAQFDPKGAKYNCCSPPVVKYQGDLIEAVFRHEPVGWDVVPDLLFINYKAPDYAGHLYNMEREQTGIALRAVDAQLGRLVNQLESMFEPGEFALIATADHGQCPLPNTAGGVRLDPIQLGDDIEAAFGSGSGPKLVENVRPAEVFLNDKYVSGRDIDTVEIAAFLRDYTYGENYHLYRGIPRDSVQWNRRSQREFAAVLPSDFIEDLGTRAPASYGPGLFADTDTPVPKI